MSEENQIEQVNRHYLDKVMDLAEELDVEATEDIVDARGMKLIAKGARISREQQEKLILHKLRKPLESCIAVHGGFDGKMMQAEAQRIVDTVEPVACLVKANPHNRMSPLDLLKRVELGSAMRMMLTMTERGGNAALEHSVTVSLIAICLARKLGLNEQGQSAAALAGLLHDIGELYIDPAYLNLNRPLLPHEWRHVVVHPQIGRMLIDELDNYPAAVGIAVAEHHERFDGGGYPRRLGGQAISPAGQAVSVAEMISPVCTEADRPLERAELTLKIVPGEHAHQLVTAVSAALQVPRTVQEPMRVESDSARTRLQALSGRIGSVLRISDDLAAQNASASTRVKTLLDQSADRVKAIERAFVSTGLDSCLAGDAGLLDAGDMAVAFEAGVVIHELEWRLREVARDLALRAPELPQEEADALQPLIALLDEQS